jgi:hypothetical protein
MKKFTKFLMAGIMMSAMVGFISCSKDEEKEETTIEESTSYAIYYEGQALTAGQTIVVSPTADLSENPDVAADLFMYNKTSNTLNTCFKVELVDGPASMNEAPVCYGVCQSQQLPYTHEPISLAPGMDPKPIQVHVYMGLHEGAHTGTYRITVGEGTSLANPQVCNIKFNW